MHYPPGRVNEVNGENQKNFLEDRVTKEFLVSN